MTLASTSVEPTLPPPQGPLSAAVLEMLTGDPVRRAVTHVPVTECDPFGIDLQLALYVCYELHYRGFAGVDPGWEWNRCLLVRECEFGSH